MQGWIYDVYTQQSGCEFVTNWYNYKKLATIDRTKHLKVYIEGNSVYELLNIIVSSTLSIDKLKRLPFLELDTVVKFTKAEDS